MPFERETIREILLRIRMHKHPLVTIDGPCASGKTTLAALLAEMISAAVVHTDDYVVPHAQKTADRLAVPGGNCDADRLLREVILPWKQHLPVRMHRYDCKADLFLPEETLPQGEILILEGSYSNLPEIRQQADMRIFLDITRETREARLQQRETPESLKRFRDRWIPLEDAYFTAYRLPDEGCIVISGETGWE
jgi:uridine kinase